MSLSARSLASTSLPPTPLLALAVFTIWAVGQLADSPRWGTRLRLTERNPSIQELEFESPLHAAGGMPGETVVSIDGIRLPSWLWVEEPDLLGSWARIDSFHRFQDRIDSVWNDRIVRIELEDQGGRRTVILRTERIGWSRAFLKCAPLAAVGWSFALLGWFLWRRRQDGLTRLAMSIGFTTSLTLLSLAPVIQREVVLGNSFSDLLQSINHLAAIASTCMAFYFACLFPKRMDATLVGWRAGIPASLGILVVSLHLLRAPIDPRLTSYGAESLFMLCFFSIIVHRFRRETSTIERSRLKWMALAFLCGFLPWLLLTAAPTALGMSAAPERLTMLFFVFTPIGLGFAITRFRLLDVGRFTDWLLAHTALVLILALVEFTAWKGAATLWLDSPSSQRTVLALAFAALVFLYFPMRDQVLHWLAYASGRERIPFQYLVHDFVIRTTTGIQPRIAMIGTLSETLRPAQIEWLEPSDPLLRTVVSQLRQTPSGVLGIDLAGCLPDRQEAAWVPVEGPRGTEAIVLHPKPGSSWRRSDLETARYLAFAMEPLLIAHALDSEREARDQEHVEQRQAMLREIHDGIGSRLFGLTLLASGSDAMSSDAMRQKLSTIESEARHALGELRTGISIIGTLPHEFVPALAHLLGHQEQILSNVGIELDWEMDSGVGSARFPAATVLSMLRVVQEALANLARHSKASTASLRIGMDGDDLEIDLRDDGIGFEPDHVHAGHGLSNMRRRMADARGSLLLESSPGEGTRLVFRIPSSMETPDGILAFRS